MSIRVCIHNRKGEWIEMDRACFGFLSYINQWDSDDVEDHSDNFDNSNYEDEGIEGFESHELASVDYIENVDPDLLKNIKLAMAELPQYYGNVVVNEEPERGYNRVTFNIPLCDAEKENGLPMQPAVIAGMMLRNVCCYTGQKATFTKLVEAGVNPGVAFTLAQAFPFRQNGLNKSQEGFYRTFGGDETIFKGESRLCDIVAMAKGELGDCWQGAFGDTDNGYGRYGEYDHDTAPSCDRTKLRKELANVTLITKGWEKSPLLNSPKGLGCGVLESNDRLFMRVDDMVNNLVPQIMEMLK